MFLSAKVISALKNAMESSRYENYNHLRSLSLSMNTFFFKKRRPLENGSVLQKSLSVNIHKVKLQIKLGKIAFSRISGVFKLSSTHLFKSCEERL